jgi:hypothetical protein
MTARSAKQRRAWLTAASRSGTVAGKMTRTAAMIRPLILTLGVGLALSFVVPTAQSAQAQTALRAQHGSAEPLTDVSSQQRRAPRRVRIYPRGVNPDEVYPRYNPGPNAVRDCTATYVQEYRPSGTVIVPRMNCFWRRG